jgi:hypothetical protein
MDEIQLSTAVPPVVRFREAAFFRTKFITASGPPVDSHFEMIAFFDAFLFSIVSIEDMVNNSLKSRLQTAEVFLFLKAARNVTTHHSVLAAPFQPNGFARPLPRRITEHAGGSSPYAYAKFAVSIRNFRKVFHQAAVRYPRGASHFLAGETYLNSLEARGVGEILLEDVMQEGLNVVAAVLGI